MNKRLALVLSVLLAALLVLAACGGDEEPTPTTAPEPTQAAEPTATPEPTTAPEPTQAPEASAAVTTTESVTTTEAVTATAEMTGTETMTATEEMTGTETMTATEEMTGTATVTDTAAAPASGEAIKAKTGEAVKMILLPKFVGIAVFDEANQGAQEAHKELGNPEELVFTGPTAEKSVEGQIETVTNAPTQGQQALMISNNAGEQIIPAVKAAKEAGLTVVTWDSNIPTAEGEDVFIAQVDFDETGRVMADMALSILGEDGGKFAILSASPDASNQNQWIAAMEEALKDAKYSKLELLDTVYGNDQSEESYKQALALVDKYPDMELIMAPTSVGIVAAAKAMTDEGLCDTVKVSGLGLPSEMKEYTLSGCAPEFALWSFVDLGYLTYYTTYLLATGQMEAKDGVTFEAGRMGTYTITKDPTRDNGLRVLMGPFSVYNKDNVEQ